jgi:hypothetical protein
MAPVVGIQKSKVAVWIWLLAIFGAHMVWAGENVWTSLGPDGGAVSALVIDPQNTSTVYAGTGNGVFKSTDGGASWRAVSAGLPGPFVASLVIDPQNTTTLYAWINYYGVFKTTNGGTSWIPAGSGLPAYYVDLLELPGLVIDPQDSETLYAAAGAVYKTIDEALCSPGTRFPTPAREESVRLRAFRRMGTFLCNHGRQFCDY